MFEKLIFDYWDIVAYFVENTFERVLNQIKRKPFLR